MPLNKEQRLALRQRWHPQADDRVFGMVERALDRYIRAGACVLDAGSGTGTWVLDRYNDRIRLLVGADIEPPAQRSLAAPVLADLAALPFTDGSFDVILCYNVIEHLADPGQALREFARLLTRGGALIFKTPNATAPVTALGNRLPLGLRRRIKGQLGVGAEHVFPTYYRCNTLDHLHRALTAAGLQCEMLLAVDQTYDYLYFSRATYVLGLLYSRLVGSPCLSWLRNAIIGVYTKGVSAGNCSRLG
jgi:SAM-dependent methyltransferase